MASGDQLGFWNSTDFFTAGGNFARRGKVATSLIPCLLFDDTTDETAFALGRMPGQWNGSDDFEAVIAWGFITGQTGTATCDWEVSIAALTPDVDSWTTLTFDTAQTVLSTEASADGEFVDGVVTFDVSATEDDDLQPGEPFVLRLVRDAPTDSTGDAQVTQVELRIT